MTRRPPPPRHLRLVVPDEEPAPRNVIVPVPEGSTSAWAILAYHSAALGDSAKLITNAAMASVEAVLNEHGLGTVTVEEGGALRTALTTVVAERYRDLVVSRLMEMHGDPDAVAGLTNREALIHLLSGPPHD